MKIDSLKELEAAIKVCRKHGVTSLEIDGIKLQLLELQNESEVQQDQSAARPIVQYTDEELLTWSSTPQAS